MTSWAAKVDAGVEAGVAAFISSEVLWARFSQFVSLRMSTAFALVSSGTSVERNVTARNLLILVVVSRSEFTLDVISGGVFVLTHSSNLALRLLTYVARPAVV